MRILILDDNKSYGDLLASACKKLGHQGVVKQDPAEALTYLKEQNVDAFLVDLDMPKMKGTVFATLVRQQGCELPIAICTGSCVDDELTARAEAMGEVLPKIWTHADLRRILRTLQLQGRARVYGGPTEDMPPHEGPEVETLKDVAPPLAVQKLAAGTGTTPKDSVREDQTRGQPPADPPPLRVTTQGSFVGTPSRPNQRVHIRCRSWEQVRKLCSDVMGGLTCITVRAQADLGNGQQVVLALALPDEMVVSIDATIVETRTAGSDGRRPYQLDLIGFGGDEMSFLLERCDENEETAPEATSPVAERVRPAVPLAPSTPADTLPNIPESVDSVDLQYDPSYAPKISWD